MALNATNSNWYMRFQNTTQHWGQAAFIFWHVQHVLSARRLNTLRPRQNGRLFPDDIFKCIFLNENVWISLKISLKFVPKVPINSIPALVMIMACRRPGDKPLSEPMMVSLPTQLCVTRPQWVKQYQYRYGTKAPLDRIDNILNEIYTTFRFAMYSWCYCMVLQLIRASFSPFYLKLLHE